MALIEARDERTGGQQLSSRLRGQSRSRAVRNDLRNSRRVTMAVRRESFIYRSGLAKSVLDSKMYETS